MKKEKIVRALRDPEYRDRLTAEELAALPDHAAGPIELHDEQLTPARGPALMGANVAGTVNTTNTPGTYASCCYCCAVAAD